MKSYFFPCQIYVFSVIIGHFVYFFFIFESLGMHKLFLRFILCVFALTHTNYFVVVLFLCQITVFAAQSLIRDCAITD